MITIRGKQLWQLSLLLVFSACLAFGQSSGSISGTVQDPSGAIIPNATVTAQNLATNVDTKATTNGAGFYRLQLPAGSYKIEASAAGFQSLVHDKVTVDALASVALNMTLTVGATTTEVEVTSTTDTIQTDNTTLGSTLRNEVYAALPLQMSQGVPRDPTSFVALAPGVATVVLESAGPSFTSFNGGQQEVNGLYFEGLPISFPNQMGDTRPIALAVSVDAVNQFQVEVNGEKAEYQGQGFHNYVLKSGTSQFHGNLFEYFRNTAFDAKNYFYNFVPADHQNEYGGNIGGPIKKDKLFFFANYDAYDFNTTSAPTVLTIPDNLERAGNFSELPTQLFDPSSQSCNGSTCTKRAYTSSGQADTPAQAASDPLYNVLPAGEISGVSRSFVSYLPAVTGNGFLSNYSKPLNRAIQDKNITTRVDYNISPADQLYGVFAYGKWSTDYTGNLTPTGTALPLPYTQSPGIVVERPLISEIHETHTLSSSMVNDFGLGFVRLSIPIFPITQAGKYPENAGLNGLPGSGQAANGFPGINFTGSNIPANWAGAGPFNEWENDVMGQDALTWVRGRHTFKFGFTYQSTQDNSSHPADGTSATFTFSSNETAGFSPNSSALAKNTGNALASFMLGAVDSSAVTHNTVVETGSRFHNYSLFAQDDWKVTTALNVNLGLRWDMYAPYGEEHNRFSFAVPTLANPAANNIPGALVYGQGLVPAHYKNFQPRVGFEYQLGKATVVRGGFVMANTLGALGIGGNGPNGPGQNGYNPPSAINSTVTGQPAFYWSNGVPAPVTPVPILTPGFGAGNSTVNPSGAIAPPILAFPELAGRSPEYINYSFGIQRDLPGQMTFGITYSGSQGRYLSRYSAVGPYSNSMDPKYLALGSLLTAQATPANVTAAQAMFPNVGLPFPNFKGTIATMLLPFPQYAAPINNGAGSGGTTCYSCDEGSSSYNSMQVTLQRHLTRGFTAQFAYTLAKEIDDVQNTKNQIGAVGGGSRNPYDHRLDRGLGAIDHRHNIHVTWVYELPAGKGHLLSGGAIGDAILGHWEWTGIYTFETGFPMGITGTNCNVPGIVSNCMVNLNPNFSGPVVTSKIGSGNAHTGVYLNKSAFTDPAPYTFGNEPRSAPYGLTNPAMWEVDSTLRRSFPIHDQISFNLSADFFNLLNNVVFAPPVSNIDAANFGTVTTTQNSPRRIQFSGRISF